MNMMRVPNLSGNFDSGPNVSGEYKNIKIIILTGKSFKKQFTFPVRKNDIGYVKYFFTVTEKVETTEIIKCAVLFINIRYT